MFLPSFSEISIINSQHNPTKSLTDEKKKSSSRQQPVRGDSILVKDPKLASENRSMRRKASLREIHVLGGVLLINFVLTAPHYIFLIVDLICENCNLSGLVGAIPHSSGAAYARLGLQLCWLFFPAVIIGFTFAFRKAVKVMFVEC